MFYIFLWLMHKGNLIGSDNKIFIQVDSIHKLRILQAVAVLGTLVLVPKTSAGLLF